MTILLLILFDLAVCLFNGWCLSLMWKWFVVTSLHAPQISVLTGAGLSIMAAMLRGSKPPVENEETADVVLKTLYSLMIELFLLGFAAFIHFFLQAP